MTSSITENEELKISHLFDVSKFTAVVTGAGTGIGLMITEALVTNGAKVYITGRREAALNKVVELYSKGPGEIIAIPGDITNKSDVKRLADEIANREPDGIQLLVNNAGIARDNYTRYSTNGKPDFASAQSIADHLWKSDPEEWQETFLTNVTSQYFVSVAFLPQLAKGGQKIKGFTSSIVNISSISGVMKGSSIGQYAYGTSKAAFIQLTRMLATTFAEAKVRVNSIAPGIFPSEMTAGSSDENQKSKLKMNFSIPAGRPGNDMDMAACILYLAGPGGVFLNGQVIFTDGGESLNVARRLVPGPRLNGSFTRDDFDEPGVHLSNQQLGTLLVLYEHVDLSRYDPLIIKPQELVERS